MSDLQCPATILIACHGDAEYVRLLVEQVRTRRVAEVYSSAMHRAVESAEMAASALGVRAVAVVGLQELSVGEQAVALVERFTGALEVIADRHRGETVLVFTHSRVMALVVPQLPGNVRNDHAAQRIPHNSIPVEVEVDSDGWRLISWPGATDTSMVGPP